MLAAGCKYIDTCEIKGLVKKDRKNGSIKS